MRIAGWILLVGGFFLCISVVWAAPGFLLMGLGLISLQVAEHNRRRARSVTTFGERPDTPPEEHKVVSVREQTLYNDDPRRANSGEPSHDRQTWRRLVESDADLMQLTSVLADYGQNYVDELAKDYLAAVDKKRLPEIIGGIIRRARGNVTPRSIGRSKSDVKSSTSNAAVDGLDQQQRSLPAAESEFVGKLPASRLASLVETAGQETTSATVQESFPG